MKFAMAFDIHVNITTLQSTNYTGKSGSLEFTKILMNFMQIIRMKLRQKKNKTENARHSCTFYTIPYDSFTITM